MSELHAACLSCPNNLGAIRLRDQHMDLQKSYNQSESSRTALNVNLADIKAMYAKDLNDIENEYTVRIAFLEKALSIKDELNEALREKTSTLETQLAEAKKNALEWVTYDGTPETLPIEAKWVVLNPATHSRMYTPASYDPPMNGHPAYWATASEGDLWDISIGDRWAYLLSPADILSPSNPERLKREDVSHD